MARIRKIAIQNFRGIFSLDWTPAPGLNCLVGPGDSAKSTILDAIDLCLGARRTVTFCDDDFHRLNTSDPIVIAATIGALSDQLRSLEAYGPFLQGWNAATNVLEAEPGTGLESALTVELRVAEDLEPQWTLVGSNAAAQGLARNLAWADRVRLAPTRLGDGGDYNLSWRRGSILNRVSEERASATAAIAAAAREARNTFGEGAKAQLANALEAVRKTATQLGIPVGSEVRALLDAHSVSFAGGTISLHDAAGVPLRRLGLGSTRLLVAGLQRLVAEEASIVLVDELEHGLEPHRIIRLLTELGAKDSPEPLQAFMSTHSPVAIRELSANQLFVVRRDALGLHEVSCAGASGDVQGTIRRFPDALLSKSLVVGEGISEIGLVRGIDLYRIDHGAPSLTAMGVGLVDGGGDETFARALALQAMGYRTTILRDSDKPAPAAEEARFLAKGGTIFAWTAGLALEDEIFASVSDAAVAALLARAIELRSDILVDAHIRSASGGAVGLADIQAEIALGGPSAATRALLARAAKTKSNSWFKRVDHMEEIGREIIGPDYANCQPGFRSVLDGLFAWMPAGG